MEHSGLGPNVDAKAKRVQPTVHEEIVNPLEKDYATHLPDYSRGRALEMWEKVRDTTSDYANAALTLDALDDDYQSLFVHIYSLGSREGSPRCRAR